MRRFNLLILHVSLLVILAGGIVTWLTAEETTLFLAPEMPTRKFDINLELRRFEVEFYPDGETPRNYASHILVNGREETLEVNSPISEKGWMIYQQGFTPDGGSVISMRRDGLGTGVTFAGYGLFLLAGLLMGLPHIGRKMRQLRGVLVPSAICLGVAAFFIVRKYSSTPLLPVLDSAWLPVHIALVISAYSMFIVIALRAAAKGSRDPLMRRALTLAVWLLGMGIWTGAVWASRSWGRYWGWDPKETMALITMLVYAVPLHLHRPSRWWYIVPLLMVAMTYFGVKLFTSLHSY